MKMENIARGEDTSPPKVRRKIYSMLIKLNYDTLVAKFLKNILFIYF